VGRAREVELEDPSGLNCAGSGRASAGIDGRRPTAQDLISYTNTLGGVIGMRRE